MVGIGPGGPQPRTLKAKETITASDLVVGYTPYVESLADLLDGKETFTSGMRQEVTRTREAILQASRGRTVALVSSGDAGIYGMAGLAYQIAATEKIDIPIEVIPGVSASTAAAAALGAPLMLDYATISLSDLLVPWGTICTRLEALASADIVTAIYNPRSKKRVMQLEKAVEIFSAHNRPDTPVGIVTAAGTKEETVVLTDLTAVLDHEIGMRSLVIIGNSTTIIADGKMITPRGYEV